MLYYIVTALFVSVCFLLMVVILLQQGKGGDIAAAFGGGGSGSQTAFGARSGATVLSRATSVLAILFVLGAMVLGIMGRSGGGISDHRKPGIGAGNPGARTVRRGYDAPRRVPTLADGPNAEVAELADAPA